MKLLSRRLAHKLILSLIAVATVIAIISSYVFVRTQESQILSAMIRGADQLSGAITSATWHAMLDDRRDAAYQQIQVIATKQGIDQIQIFNREGRVMFSAGGGEASRADKASMTCRVCHMSDRPLARIDLQSRTRIFRTPDGSRKLGIITPVYNETACSQASCHAHPQDQHVLGVLDVTMNLDAMDRQLARLELFVLLITLLHIVLMSVVIVAFARRFVDRPIGRLIGATRAVAAMRLDEPLELHSSEELDELARSFNSMRAQLEQAIAENNEFTRHLEQKVEERTAQLQVAHRKLLQSDRLASLGQLSASVAHEINNPVAGVLNLSMLIDRIIGENGIPPHRVGEVKHYLSHVTKETARVGRIVSDLLAFSRRSRPQSADADLNALVRGTLAILSHKLKLANVETVVRLDDSLPKIRCDGSQIQQVILNLVMNGAEATAGRSNGRVTVTTRKGESGSVVLEISDNGAGIPQAILPRIFDPFFTTKDESKGLGLGLAVVYGIVEAHGGGIDVESDVGRGTSFTVTLPLSGGPPESAISAAATAGAGASTGAGVGAAASETVR